MADQQTLEPARSPHAVAVPTVTDDGWLLDAAVTDAALRLTDLSPEGKLLVRADPAGEFAFELGVETGRAELFDDGLLVASVAPGEWIALSPGPASTLAEGFAQLSPDELVTTVDLTHGLGLLRLSGEAAPAVLASLAGAAVSPAVLGDGDATATPVAGARAMIVRDDVLATELFGPSAPAGELVASYLLVCDRSQCAGVFERLIEAGDEWGIEPEGYPAYRRYHTDA